MVGIQDREPQVFPQIDVSAAVNSAQAIQLLEEALRQLKRSGSATAAGLPGLGIVAGRLLLTPGVLSKIRQLLQKEQITHVTCYTSVPQTQQAALDEGFYVKEKPTAVVPLAVWLSVESGLDAATSEALNALDNFQLPGSLAAFSGKMRQQERVRQSLQGPGEYANEGNFQETLYLKQTLRSGQSIQFDGHVVIVGDCHAGSEVAATGDISIWGELRGLAHAGASGNADAEIRALKIEALQLRIADRIARRPDRIYARPADSSRDDGMLTPELARVVDGEIKIYSSRKAVLF
ncbi:MAG: septum site-determining protein MinC [Candidatus Melainabacteria bacterium]|nr:septum site-determining protein MinC [Candidatus Melainabacteria bacterium]